MKNMNTLGGAGLGLGLTLGLAACNAAPSQTPEPTPAATASYDYKANAAAARAAIAQGYDTCKITEVESSENSTEATKAYPYQSGRRGTVKIRVSANKTDESNKYETIYDDNDTVVWRPTTLGGRIKHVPVLRADQLENSEAPKSSQKFFPRFDYPEGTGMDVYLERTVDTYDFPARKYYKSTGITHCGSLVLRVNTEGGREWSINHDAPALPNEYGPVTCNLVPNPVSTPSTDPVVETFHTEC